MGSVIDLADEFRIEPRQLLELLQLKQFKPFGLSLSLVAALAPEEELVCKGLLLSLGCREGSNRNKKSIRKFLASQTKRQRGGQGRGGAAPPRTPHRSVEGNKVSAPEAKDEAAPEEVAEQPSLEEAREPGLEPLLEALDLALEELARQSRRVAALQEAQLQVAAQEAQEALDAVLDFYRALEPEGGAPGWRSREEFKEVCAALAARDQRRERDISRLLDLAEATERLSFSCRARARLTSLEEKRDKAQEELRNSATSEEPASLPGDAVGAAWFSWWDTLGAAEVNQVLDALKGLPHLMALMGELEPFAYTLQEVPQEECAGEKEAKAPSLDVLEEVSASEWPKEDVVLALEEPLVQEPPTQEMLAPALPAQERPREVAVQEPDVSEIEPEPELEPVPSSPGLGSAVEVERQISDAKDASVAPEGGESREPGVEEGGLSPEVARGAASLVAELAAAASRAAEVAQPVRVEPGDDLSRHVGFAAETRSSALCVSYHGGAQVESYGAFLESYWLEPGGECRPVPWAEATEFAAQLREATRKALEVRRLHEAFVFARACEVLGERPHVDPADLEYALDALSQRGGVPCPFRLGPEDMEHQDLVRLRLVCALFSELDHENPGSMTRDWVSQWEAVVEDPHLRGVLGWLWRLKVAGHDPFPLLDKAAKQSEQPSALELERRITKLRKAFREQLGQLWSAAGGKVERSHCREAWTRWVTNFQAEFQLYYPEGPAWQDLKGKLTERRGAMERARKNYRKYADQGGVKFSDRKVMDRASTALLASMEEILSQVGELARARERSHDISIEDFPRESWDALCDRHWSARDAVEQLCGGLLLRSSELAHQGTFELEDLCQREELLRFLPLSAESLQQVEAGQALELAPQDIEEQDFLPLAAVLYREPEDRGEEEISLGALREACRGQGRWELLAYLGPVLQRQDKHHVEGRAEELKGSITKHLDRLKELLRYLMETAHSSHQRFHDRCEEVESCLEQALSLEQLTLLHQWGILLLEWAERELLRSQESLLAQVSEEDRREKMRRAFQERRYADAYVLTGLGAGKTLEQESCSRQSLYRPHAEQKYSGDHLEGQGRGDAEDLFGRWSRKLQENKKQDHALRRRFAELLNVEFEESREEMSIAMTELRQWLVRQRLNPSFVPQLTRYQRLVVVTPNTRPDKAFFCSNVLKQLRSSYGQDMTLVLTPGLSIKLRRELLREFRRAPLMAVPVDDVDLQRIAGASTPVLAALELLFEEHRASRLMSPFSFADEGQRVHMEMFVGRREQAEELASTATYTRLFSGRKLGKSALLRFVEHTYDQTELPSRFTLRVIYVPIPGARSQRDVVSRIIKGLEERLEIELESKEGDPTQWLCEACVEFVRRFPETSLLIVLDEADAFVEAELASYEEDQEACLSFKMRSEIAAPTDPQGLPRVRFLVSGYRTTNTGGGTWANWGKVMRLNPLEANDASMLLRGPLERLGVDVSRQARNLAYQCGYQPAILLACGSALLEKINEYHPGQEPYIEVDAEMASMALMTQQVREEIRSIARANFQSNPRGELVFTALLREFNNLLPGQGLVDAGPLVQQHLQNLHVEPQVLDLTGVETILRELVDRKLLTVQREMGVSTYRLRFPHHLATLMEDRRELEPIARRVMEEAAPSSAQASSLLGARQQDVTIFVSHPPREYGVQLVVLGTNWMDAVTSQTRGVPDCAGIGAQYLFRAMPSAQELQSDECIAVVVEQEHTLPALVRTLEANEPAVLALANTRVLRELLLDPHSILGDAAVHIDGLRRLPLEVVRWWFARVRCLEFVTTEDAVEQIFALTSGVPFLVGLFERELTRDKELQGGASISASEFASAIERFQSHLAGLDLTKQGVDSLQEREIKLLRAVVIASQHYSPGDSLRELFTGGWRELEDDMGPYPLGQWMAEDVARLRLLHELGFLPLSPRHQVHDPLDNLVALEEEDPLRSIMGG